jgi:hypothetical protein
MVLPTVIKKRHLKGEKPLPVIKRKRAGKPEGFKELCECIFLPHNIYSYQKE